MDEWVNGRGRKRNESGHGYTKCSVLHGVLFYSLCTVCCVLCAVCGVLCTVWCVLCAVCCVLVLMLSRTRTGTRSAELLALTFIVQCLKNCQYLHVSHTSDLL